MIKWVGISYNKAGIKGINMGGYLLILVLEQQCTLNSSQIGSSNINDV
jgi:hypothetical protein